MKIDNVIFTKKWILIKKGKKERKERKERSGLNGRK